MNLGICACRKNPWESMLSPNNALTKNCLFECHPDFILCGYFFVPGPLRGIKVSQGMFSDKHFRIFVGGPKIDFFQGVSPGFVVKNDEILKSAFFTPLFS